MVQRKVAIIRTGGTIDMILKNGVYKPVETETELRDYLPELFEIADVSVRTLFLKDSSDMTPDDWKRIATETAETIRKYDGVVITHGTDTMGYTAAALSFMLKDLGKPVVLTGAQIPISEKNSDGIQNLLDSIYTAIHGDFRDVVVVFNSKIYKGTRVKKVRIWEKDAFISPNFPVIGTVRAKEGIVLNVKLPKRDEKKITWADTKLERKIGYIKVFPGMDPSIIKWYIENEYKGIIIEGFGAGHVNTNSFLPYIKKAIDEDIPVFMTSQCIYGEVKFKYEVGRKLEEIGVVSLRDMLPETAVVKLMYVAAHESDPEKIKKLMLTPIAGEISRCG